MNHTPWIGARIVFLILVFFFAPVTNAESDGCEIYRRAIGHPGNIFDAIREAHKSLHTLSFDTLRGTVKALQENDGEGFNALSEIAIHLGRLDALDLIRILRHSSTVGAGEKALLTTIFVVFKFEALLPEPDYLEAFIVLKAHEVVYAAACR